MREPLEVHGDVVHALLMTQLLQVEGELVELLEVRGEHDHRKERLEEDGGGEGGELQLAGTGRWTSRLLWGQDKVHQVGQVAVGASKWH